MNINWTTIAKGMAMGVAEAIPGVSGGTIAFITGIYTRLLGAINALLAPRLLKTLRQPGGLAEAWKQADGGFLLQLLCGMAFGLVSAVFTITALLEHYPPAVWAFFFGLIIASTVFIVRQVGRWTLREVLLFAFGTLGAYVLTVLNPLQGSTQPLLVFLAGAIAICALILPGISGSFILVLLGMYTVVFPALKNLLSGDLSALSVVLVFGLGCLTGLALFSRLLAYTFARFPHPTLALLAGFMLGSLNKLWPWRNTLSTRINSSGELVPLREANVMPAQYQGEPIVIAVILALLLGLVLVYLLERYGQKDEASNNTLGS